MNARLALPLVLLLAVASAAGWYLLRPAPPPEHWLGYAEADYVRLAPTLQGRLVSLSVARGDVVAAGAPLFTQDDGDDQATLAQADATLAEQQQKLADLQAPSRVLEVTQANADLADMQAARDRVATDLARSQAIVASGAVTRQSVDQLRDDLRSAQAKVESARARLALLRDPTGRIHAITAQQAAIDAAKASVAAAQWRIDQRRVVAPTAGTIADTFAEPGETIAAGTPVVSLLPPQNIRVRFFVPETALARLHPGQSVAVACDSCPAGLHARVSFIATQPEYTPPVIYSQNARLALVYLIEAQPDPAARPLLKPGQPVDITPPAP